jgi:hypothetical protein
MRTFLLAILLSFPAISLAADSPATTTWKHGGKQSTFADGLGTYYEGLIIALVGNCSSEGGDLVATQERWDKALAGDHLRVQFAQSRAFRVTGEPEELEAEEIVVPISATSSPDHILVRNGNRYRAFAKYEHKICSFIQANLKGLLEAR